MWDVSLSVAEVFPIVVHRRTVVHSVNHSVLPAHSLPHRISNGNLVWEAHANLTCQENQTTDVRGHDRNRQSATIWPDRDQSDPIDEKGAPGHVVAGDGD